MFHPISLKHLLQLILNEYQNDKSVFGIPEELFFNPLKNPEFKVEQFNQFIDSPLGVAAGPHSQMAQNIIASWLVGARYIELKTIQTLDELEIPKPCIDMQDEGYNCEWSQELKIKESYNEYLNAWVIIHILNHKFRWGKNTGTIFNMSVGYNLEGILKENVQWFFDKMEDCSNELSEKLKSIQKLYPDIKEIEVPSKISDNITLSTMHGCPANEIEDIARYLLEEKNLHTYVKLNPTLLGPKYLREILNDQLNYKTEVPDIAFEHDLKYPDAIKIIQSLQKIANQKKLHFGLKLTNTLESVNNKQVFGGDVDMMYMSGRALHPISIQVAKKLQTKFNGALELSFSAGADAFNISDILSCGFKTVTVCSDILKPGGYMKLNQYFEELKQNKTVLNTSKENASNFLNKYTSQVIYSDYFKRNNIKAPTIKTERKLSYFDCVSAPCKDTCATNQDIPDYLYYSSKNQFNKAYKAILKTNPFPAITGVVCDHLCQNKCTRVHYDNSLLIREVKRFISEQQEIKLTPGKPNHLKVAIIGAGPSGMSAAYYLALAGFSVEVFEAKPKAGGMVAYAIPGFRLTDSAIEKDLKRITELGVKIHFNTKVDSEKFQNLRGTFNYVFIGVGAQLSAPFHLLGINSKGVLDSLEFLFRAKEGKETGIGEHVVIIGGGNTAMDAARTAYRLVGEKGKVTIVYRRTVNEMPADQGEIKAVIEEGMEIIELVSPEEITHKNGKVKSIIVSKMELKEADSSGRPKPVKIVGSEYEIECDTVIPAIGQSLDIDFTNEELLKAKIGGYETQLENVFIGGDALRGAATAIKAIGDGRKAAEKITKKAQIDFKITFSTNRKEFSRKELILKRAKRKFAPKINELSVNNRKNFKLVSETLPQKAIVEEAERCLQCDEICNICTTVCPNFANYSYEVEPISYYLQNAVRLKTGEIEIQNEGLFEVNQKYQVLNIDNFCNECGNCNTFCPTNSAPYKEKPKFYLTKQGFDLSDEGFYFKNGVLIQKKLDEIQTLSDQGSFYTYENNVAYTKLNKQDFSILELKFKTDNTAKANFYEAAEMSILLKAAKNLVFN